MRARGVLSVVGLVVLVLSLAMPLVARADGVVIVEPPPCDVGTCPDVIPVGDQLEITYHHVDVTIADQVATTKIDQVFHNPNDWAAEGIYIFPIPDEATIGEFTMYVNGEPIEAKILSADEARLIYDDIVRRRRDPALLEYVGRGAIQASIFPIPAFEDRRIEIEYSQVLTVEQGLVRYVYPLNTERFSAQPLEQVSVRVTVESKDPVRAVYSPSHSIAIDRQDDFHFAAGYEATNVLPDTDFELFYSVSQDQISANLISYYDSIAQEGYFMLLAAPSVQAPQEVVAKDVIVILDTSGSMEGEKIVQAKGALTYILDHLNPGDRFNIVEFSTGVRVYASELQDASAAPEARSWVERLQATGGTDINLALLEAMAMVKPERPTLVMFLTDGLPTEGEVEVPRILANVDSVAPENVRLFAFGVGDDVDTILLDTLAQAHHGTSSYVRPGEPLDEAVSGFWAKVSTPVLADLTIDFGGVQVYDVYPAPLPDLFAGTQIVVLGRYRAGGPATVTLSGQVNDQVQSFSYADQTFSTSGGDEFLPRLWATRHVGYLLNQIRLYGEKQEWIDAIVNLSVRYGIVTPYTSYLITEDDILTQEGRQAVADEEYEQAQNAPAAPASGGAAVSTAEAMGEMADADVAAAPAEEYQGAIRVVGSRAFVLQNEVWIETTFDPSTTTTTKVEFASDAYFQLLAEHPDLAPAFALGPRVIAISGGQAYESTAEASASAQPDSAASGASDVALFGVVPLAGLVVAGRWRGRRVA